MLRRPLLTHFYSCLKSNLTFGGLLGLVAGLAHASFLLWDNRFSLFEFPYLSLVIFCRETGLFFPASLGAGVLFSLIFGIRNRKELNLSSLLIKEALWGGLTVVLLIVLKKYASAQLQGGAAYLAFYVSRWVKLNPGFFAGLVAAPILVAFLRIPFKKVDACFSWKILTSSLGIFLLLQTGVYAYSQILQARLRRLEAPNVILISVDTLRADHMSFYGYPRLTTPHLDQLAKESVVFRNTVAPWTKTNQSFAGLFTGKYCYLTGIGRAVASALPRHNFLLSEYLKNRGYLTAAFVSNANLSSYFNYHEGYDTYLELWRKQKGPMHERGWYKADRVTREAVTWLENHRDRKFFMWIHYIDPHTVYDPPPPYNDLFLNDALSGQYEDLPLEKIKPSNRIGQERDPDLYIARYDGAVRFTDKQIHIFLIRLKELALEENTLLIFTSDHGESFVDNHLFFEHGMFVYESCAGVPLFIRYPRKLKPQWIEETTSLIDVYPTLLGLLDLPPSRPLQGFNLEPSLTGGAWSRPPHVLIESDQQLGLRTLEWKLIYAKTNDAEKMGGASPFFELFDLRSDPGEKQNLSGSGVSIENKLEQTLFKEFKGARGDLLTRTNTAAPDVDPETLEQLRSLGYIN